VLNHLVHHRAARLYTSRIIGEAVEIFLTYGEHRRSSERRVRAIVAFDRTNGASKYSPRLAAHGSPAEYHAAGPHWLHPSAASAVIPHRSSLSIQPIFARASPLLRTTPRCASSRGAARYYRNAGSPARHSVIVWVRDPHLHTEITAGTMRRSASQTTM
jgi:hypothetical protein